MKWPRWDQHLSHAMVDGIKWFIELTYSPMRSNIIFSTFLQLTGLKLVEPHHDGLWIWRFTLHIEATCWDLCLNSSNWWFLIIESSPKESTCSHHSLLGFCLSPYVFLQTLAIPSPLTTSHRSVKPPDDHRLLDDSPALSRNSRGVLLRKFDGSGPKYASDYWKLPQTKMAMEHPPCSTGNTFFFNGGSFFIATLVFREVSRREHFDSSSGLR